MDQKANRVKLVDYYAPTQETTKEMRRTIEDLVMHMSNRPKGKPSTRAARIWKEEQAKLLEKVKTLIEDLSLYPCPGTLDEEGHLLPSPSTGFQTETIQPLQRVIVAFQGVMDMMKEGAQYDEVIEVLLSYAEEMRNLVPPEIKKTEEHRVKSSQWEPVREDSPPPTADEIEAAEEKKKTTKTDWYAVVRLHVEEAERPIYLGRIQNTRMTKEAKDRAVNKREDFELVPIQNDTATPAQRAALEFMDILNGGNGVINGEVEGEDGGRRGGGGAGGGADSDSDSELSESSEPSNAFKSEKDVDSSD